MGGTKDSSVRNIYNILIDEGIDSVLNSLNLTRDNLHRIIMDTDIVNRNLSDDYPSHGLHDDQKRIFPWDLRISQFIRDNKITGYTSNEEIGVYSVSVNGKIRYLPPGTPDKTFSFTRLRRYTLEFENKISAEPKTFWDSTAKPILVTVGAAAVIALFFLVRG